MMDKTKDSGRVAPKISLSMETCNCDSYLVTNATKNISELQSPLIKTEFGEYCPGSKPKSIRLNKIKPSLCM